MTIPLCGWKEFVKRFADLNPDFDLVMVRPDVSPLAVLEDSLRENMSGTSKIHACGLFNLDPRRYLYISIDELDFDSFAPYCLPGKLSATGDTMDDCSPCLVNASDTAVHFNRVLDLAIDEVSPGFPNGMRTVFLVPHSSHHPIRYALIPIHDSLHPAGAIMRYTGMMIVPCIVDLAPYV